MSENPTSPQTAQHNQQRQSIYREQIPSFTALNTPKANSFLAQNNRSSSIIFTHPHTGKLASVRVESPRTQLAMKQLGILPQNLQHKSFDDFGGANTTDKIKQLRYDHYLERTQQDFLDIIRKRKEIIQRERVESLRLNDSITTNTNYNQLKQAKFLSTTNRETQNNSVASTKANTTISGVRLDKQKFFLQTSVPQKMQKQNSSSNLIKQVNQHLPKDNLNITTAFNSHTNHFKSQNQKHSQYRSFSESKVNPLHMSQVFEKTVKYLRQSHDTPEVFDGSQILNNGDDHCNDIQEYDPFETQMEKEIDRYNRLKMQKQKEAKYVYLDELKKQKMVEDMAKREKQMAEFKIKEELKKQQKKEKDKERALEKLEQIRSYNHSKDKQKMKEKEEVIKRLDDLKQKQQEQSIEAEQMQELKKNERKQRFQIISRAKSECQLRDFKESQRQYKIYLTKMMQSDDQHKQKLEEKQKRTKDRLSQEQQRLDNYLNSSKQREIIQFSQFVEKLYDKDKKYRQSMDKQIREDILNRQLMKEKENKLRDNQKSVMQQKQERKNQLNEKFKQIEENIIKRKEDQEETFKVKQELRNLKLNYMHEKFQRHHRINDHKLEIMLDKEKWHQENISAIKNQKEYVKQAKKEVYNQYRAEGDRLFEGIKIIQENLFPTQITPSQQSNVKRGIKILKKIFKQEESEEKELEDRFFPKNKVVPVQQNNSTIGSQYILRDQ